MKRRLIIIALMLLFSGQQVFGELMLGEHLHDLDGSMPVHSMSDAGVSASADAGDGGADIDSFCETLCLCPSNGCQSMALPSNGSDHPAAGSVWREQQLFLPSGLLSFPYRPPVVV